MTKFLVLTLIGLFAQPALGNELGLKELQRELRRSNGGWQAGETSVSRLSREEKKRRLGAILPEGFGENFVPAVLVRNVDLPASFDWRNVDGLSYASPILNQGSCGSCVAFAAVATMETQMNISRKTPVSPWAFSPQHLFSCGGGICDRGWTPSSAMAYLKKEGIPDEACFPYTAGAMGADLACSKTCPDAKNRSEKIVSSTMPSMFFSSVEAVKKALLKGPLVTAMRVYEDFVFYKGGVYKHVTGEMAGGHAVSIVGWNDADKSWIVRNSWGEEWGEKGYFRIAWDDDSSVGSQTWGLVTAEKNGFVSLGSLRDREVLIGSVSIEAESTYPGTTSVEWVMKRGESPVWWDESEVRRSVKLDTNKFVDGTYTLIAKANHADGVTESQPRTVYILNGAFKGSLTFSNITEAMVVKEKIHLEVDLTHAPIPFTKVIFRAKNMETGEVIVRATPNVLPKMKFLWRANLVPDGEYELALEGQAGPNVSVKTKPVLVTVEQ